MALGSDADTHLEASRIGRSRRRLWAPVRSAAAHLRYRPTTVMLVNLGIAAATALLVGVGGGSVVTREQTIGSTLARLPASERAFRVTWGGLAAGSSYPHLTAIAGRGLNRLSPARPVSAVLLRQSTFGGGLVQLAAVAELSRWARVTSGRLPHGPCTPHRCEVLQVGTPGPPVVRAPGLRFVTVGHGRLTSGVPLGNASPPAASGPTAEAHYASSHPPPPYLITGDVGGFATLPALRLIYRTYDWSAPIQPGAVHAWDIDRLLTREAASEASLSAAGYQFALTAPDQTLLGAQSAGRVAQRRMLLIGGGAAAFLLVFVLVSGSAFRRGLAAEWDRLEERGAQRWQLWLFATSECAGTAALGVGTGLALGVAATAWTAHANGLAAATLLSHSVVSWAGSQVALLAWLVASVVLLAVTRLEVSSPTSRPGPIDLIGLGALGALVLAATRGSVDPASLGGTTIDPLIPLLPVLLAVVVLAVMVRLLPVGLRLAERVSRRGWVTLRLALVSLARRPEPAAVTATAVAVSLGFGLFAATYRATLIRAQHDQAAYQVPLDFTLTEGSALVLPLQAAPLQDYRRLAGGIDAFPILRRSATVTTGGTQPAPVTLLGLPPAAIAKLNGWRGDFARLPQSRIAARLAVGAPSARLRGATIPTDTRTLSVRASARGDPIQLGLAIADRDGTFTSLRLGTLAGDTRRTLIAACPARARAGLVVGLQVGPSGIAQETLESVGGTLHLGPLIARARPRATPVTGWREWIGKGGLTPTPRPNGVAVSYAVSGQTSALLRPLQATDERGIPVLASGELAAGAGGGSRLVISLPAQQVRGRVVATGELFPTTQDTGSRFVVADERQLALALNSAAPGTGIPDELWLALHTPDQARSVEHALHQPPFNTLQVASRTTIDNRLGADPLSHGILATLLVAALLALAFALLGVLLATSAAMRDERAELLELEAQGVDPRVLRRCLCLRAAVVAVAGLLAGAVVGAVLAPVVIDLVRVSANGSTPLPPLVQAFDAGAAAIGAASFIGAAAILIGGVTRGWFTRSTLHPDGEVEA